MAEDTSGVVENNEQEMIGEGAPVSPATDPEVRDADEHDSDSDSNDSDVSVDALREDAMIGEGAPVSPATDPDIEEAHHSDAGNDSDDADPTVEPLREEAMIAEGAPVSPETEPAPIDAEDAAEEGELPGAPEDSDDSEYRRRLREYTKELKKLPGQWYIIQSYSGYENKVKTNLDMRIQTLEVEDSIYDVVVPIEQAVEMRDGKRKLVKRKLLPGYVLVRMDMNDAAWSVVRETPGVTSFVGNEGNATPVKHRDVAKFLMPKEPAVVGEETQTSTVNAEGETVVAMPEETTKKVEHDFKVGEAVTILSGALATVSATISEIDPETGKIQALVSIFGRETPVELTADQIERIM